MWETERCSPLGAGWIFTRKIKTVQRKKKLSEHALKSDEEMLSNKKAAFPHFLHLMTQFNKSYIHVALCVVKACRQVAVTSWKKKKKNCRKRIFLLLSIWLYVGASEAELQIACSWAQPAGPECKQQPGHEPCISCATVSLFTLKAEKSSWSYGK